MKKIAWTAFGALLVMGLAGCNNQQASGELQRELEERNVPLAIAWVEENVEGAENVTAEVFHPSTHETFSDLVSGTYDKNGKTYDYYFNVDTGEYISDEPYAFYYECAEIYIKSLLPEELVYESIYFSVEGESITGHLVSDQDNGKPRAETEYYESVYDTYNMLHPQSEAELMVRAVWSVDNRELILYVKECDLAQIEPMFSDLAYIQEHPFWEIHFVRSDSDDNYINAYWDDCFVLMHYYKVTNKDGKSEVQYDYISKSEPGLRAEPAEEHDIDETEELPEDIQLLLTSVLASKSASNEAEASESKADETEGIETDHGEVEENGETEGNETEVMNTERPESE